VSFQTQTKMMCDRCGLIEVVDAYATSCQGWTHLKVGTFKAVLFPGQRACGEGQHFEQDKWLCPKCTAAFVSWMQPGQLVELTGALRALVDELRARKKSEAVSFTIERLSKLLG